MARPIKIQSDDFVIDAGGAENEYDPSLAALANGRIMFGFTNEPTVGDPNAMEAIHELGGAVSLNIANAAGADEQHVSVSGFQSGAMVAAAWTERNDATGEFDIYARVTTAGGGLTTGVDILPRFLVNAGAAVGVQDRPEIAAVGDDKIAIAWINRNTSKVDYAVYDLSGHAAFAPAPLSISNATQPFGTPTARIDIVALDDSRFIVSYRADGTFEAKFRIAYTNPSVAFATGEIDVDGTTDGNGKSGLAVLADGRFVVVYQAFDAIHGRIFNPDGTASTPVFTVSPIVSAFSLPQVAALQDGRFMAVMDGADIIAQVMNPNGTTDGDPFVVNTVSTGAQTHPVIATQPDGRVVVGWETTENGNLDIKYAIYDPRESGVTVSGTGSRDDLVGGSFNDTISGGNAGDQLRGGDGNDTLNGGPGADTLLGGSGDDVLNGGPGADIMLGGAGNDWYYIDDFADLINQELPADGAADRVLTHIDYVLSGVLNIEIITTDDNSGTTPLALTGNFLPNTIFGNAGPNTLSGGGGGDTLVGFEGNDMYFISSPTDVIIEGPAGGTMDRVLSPFSYTLGPGVYVESLTTANNSGTFAINLTGNELPNTIFGNAGANTLDGAAGADTLLGLGGDDRYMVDNAGDVVIEMAGDGNDQVFASVDYALPAGRFIETLSTASSSGVTNLTLIGNELDNTVMGNAGSNAIKGLAGNDMLYGGGGSDAFVFNTALNAGTNVDTILDFTPADDDIILARNIFPTIAPGTLSAAAFVIGAAALDADDRIIYNSANGALLYDPDGAAAGTAVLFAMLAPGLAVTNADFIAV